MQQWSVVVPAKALRLAKTRLGPTGTRAAHEELVLAMLGDTLEAVLGCAEVRSVVVVTDDPRAATVAAAAGARPVPDAPAAGLDAALRHGAAIAANPLVATLHSDLPALRPDELGAALTAATSHRRCFVADADGTGTTLLAVTDGVLEPAFGPGSAAAHAASGAIPLQGAWPGLRRDVDTPAHLAEAALLGTGPRTRAALHAACA
ncbi:2-phospho-L-lactate guanylyltransferase [Klenkia sp. PcliD-1-E]|uniref:2-phospho-L-lactate guanylyltransferase n=1 Tax=Klenkia sp. PcliD-1-E TaxID=2954492 RepID=UPI0020982A61|nr:2-phospho-L-lactate guanylyltransferase [Klenkia sp. PcliD-1-E]MCO7220098.1 2-phospho-L-lactate guanylyltransferase [Klenkia sp. PcliD-1-E]